jgi:type IV secretory pathway TraG/TraD family ATPase VirD4
MIQIINGILSILFSIFEGAMQMLADGFVSLIPAKRKEKYDADFGAVSSTLVKNGGGFYIGNWSTSIKKSHEHLITLGGSGTHKSTSIIFPTILQANSVSMVVHDPSKQTLATAEAKRKEGYTVLVLDYCNPEKSEGINMLSLCRTQADIYKIALVNVKNAIERTAEDFWTESAISLIVLMAKYLISYASPEYVTMANVLHLINVFSYKPESIDKLIVKTGDAQLLNEYKALVSLPDRTLLSVVATAKTALSVYSDPQVQKVTSFNTIDFKRFKTEKTILYIVHNAPQAEYYRAVTASFMEMFWNYLLSEITEGTYPIYFLIDEASSMRLTSLPQTVALARKHKISIALLFQDYNQLEHLYGKYEAANIMSNCATRIYMQNQPIETCMMLQNLLGKFSYTDNEGILRTRELLTAHEIRQLDRAIVLCSNKPALLLKPVPYFLQPKLKKLTELPHYEISNKLPFDVPPILNID